MIDDIWIWNLTVSSDLRLSVRGYERTGPEHVVKDQRMTLVINL